ncbi:DUF4817 domain-containing protein [Trichonephila clavipes]|nr:DUF4817 domain-containing protein [Trichonephila clavipes]
MDINFCVRSGKTVTETYEIFKQFKAAIHYSELKLLSGNDVSEKAWKVSKTTNTLDVRGLLAPLKTSKRFLRWNFGCSRQNRIPKYKFGIGRAQMPPSEKKLGVKITCSSWYRLNGAALKSDTISWGMYQLHRHDGIHFPDLSIGGTEKYLIEKFENKLSSDLFSVFGLAIHQNDHQARRRFVEWAQNEIAVVPDFHKRFLFCDEAQFWLNGYVNKQNCRIWSEANPQVYVETPLHPEKLTLWCALWADGICGPYFFKNDEGHNVTVNGDRYRAMITNFFIPELNNHDVQELWFQQDGATCHTARAIIDLLKDTFGDRLISRFGPVNWSPRFCDLTPLDYFLWGYVKSLVYADKPQTLDHLEDNIRRVIADIRPQMLENVIENWTSRLSQPWQSYARNHI